jgi:transposase InsO family protein
LVSDREQRRALVGQAVEVAYIQFKRRYGAPRLTEELNDNGIACSVNHAAELLRERGLRARNGRGFKYRPRTESRTNVNENLLGRKFGVDAPNRKWVSDITYIKAGRTWLYLAAVIDLFSRKVVGWALDTHMRESLVLDAFTMAASRRDIQDNALRHRTGVCSTGAMSTRKLSKRAACGVA